MLLLWCTLFVWCSSSTSGALAVPLRRNVSTIPAIIAFGDSLVDQGNNNYLVTLVKCNFEPYGEDYVGRIPTGRFSNAKTPPDMIVRKLGIKKLLPPYLDPNLRSEDLPTGVSFASGGSGYDPLTSKTGSVLSFSNELELFKEYISKLTSLVGEKRTKHILANSVFVVVSASNDFVNTYFTLGLRRGEFDISSYADFIVAHASDFVQAIYDLGARKIAVFGLAPIGCLPFSRTLAGGLERICVETYNEAAQIYNAKLMSMIHGLGHSLPHSKIIYADIYKPLLDIIHNPEKYGFDVVDRGCCGTGNLEVAILCNKFSKTCPHRNSYLFWDSFHPTERGYEIVVDHFLRNEFKHFL